MLTLICGSLVHRVILNNIVGGSTFIRDLSDNMKECDTRSSWYNDCAGVPVRDIVFLSCSQFGDLSPTKVIDSPIHATSSANAKMMAPAPIHALRRRETLPLKDPHFASFRLRSIVSVSIMEQRQRGENVQTATQGTY